MNLLWHRTATRYVTHTLPDSIGPIGRQVILIHLNMSTRPLPEHAWPTLIWLAIVVGDVKHSALSRNRVLEVWSCLDLI